MSYDPVIGTTIVDKDVLEELAIRLSSELHSGEVQEFDTKTSKRPYASAWGVKVGEVDKYTVVLAFAFLAEPTDTPAGAKVRDYVIGYRFGKKGSFSIMRCLVNITTVTLPDGSAYLNGNGTGMLKVLDCDDKKLRNAVSNLVLKHLGLELD